MKLKDLIDFLNPNLYCIITCRDTILASAIVKDIPEPYYENVIKDFDFSLNYKAVKIEIQ